MGALRLNPADVLKADIPLDRVRSGLKSRLLSLISAKLTLEDHATITFMTLNFVQLLVEDGVGSKYMMGALRLHPANELEAEILFRQATMLLNSCTLSLILVKLVMEYHAAIACVTLNYMQLLV